MVLRLREKIFTDRLASGVQGAALLIDGGFCLMWQLNDL